MIFLFIFSFFDACFEDGHILRVSNSVARVARLMSDNLSGFVKLILPFLSRYEEKKRKGDRNEKVTFWFGSTWQGIVQRALDLNTVFKLDYVSLSEPETFVWGSMSEEAAVGGGISKDLWAEGVMIADCGFCLVFKTARKGSQKAQRGPSDGGCHQRRQPAAANAGMDGKERKERSKSLIVGFLAV